MPFHSVTSSHTIRSFDTAWIQLIVDCVDGNDASHAKAGPAGRRWTRIPWEYGRPPYASPHWPATNSASLCCVFKLLVFWTVFPFTHV